MSELDIISTTPESENDRLSLPHLTGISLILVCLLNWKGKVNPIFAVLFMILAFQYPVDFVIVSFLVFVGYAVLYAYWLIEKIRSTFNWKSKRWSSRHSNLFATWFRGNSSNQSYTSSKNMSKGRKESSNNQKRFQTESKQSSHQHSNRPRNDENNFNFQPFLTRLAKMCSIIFKILKNLLSWIFTKLSELGEEVVEYQPLEESGWSPLGNYGVPPLQPFDMQASINELTNKKIRQPKNKTKFLKEIGYFTSSNRGTDKTFYNPTFLSLTKQLRDDVPEIAKWKATPTTAESISRMIAIKIDREPKEQHQHWSRIGKAYKVLAIWMNRRQLQLKRLSNDEVIKSMNLSGSMGMQEEKIFGDFRYLKFETLKEYVEHKVNGRYLWEERVEWFRESLEKEQPMLAIFNTAAKAERKNKNLNRANRLIWYLPATARIFEEQVFGGLEDILKKLPYSVSGIALYDYGEKLADILQQNSRKAICNDISGWDTRVSYGLLCHEANFLRSLTKDESLKKDITSLYRLYANAHVMIAIRGTFNDETVIYKLRGQVASGRRTTYAMNTLTNTVVSMCAAAYSYGIHDCHFEEWMLNCLFNGHTDDFGGKISGDDSVLIFGPRQAKLYSKNAHKFLNDIGLIRKNLDLDEDSKIIDKMEDINFCSNNFVKTKYGRKKIERWMPVKPVPDIFGKACIMLDVQKNKTTKEAWARLQGLELLVYHHHIPEVKALALALLSCTSKELSLESVSTGWKRLPKKCLQESDPLEIINNCLFGTSTKVDKFRDFKEKVVENWSDLGEFDAQARIRFGSIDDKFRQDWYKSIPVKILELRKHKQDHLYDDWNNVMSEIANENEALTPLQELWKLIRDLF